MTWQDLLSPFIWALNGLLVTLFTLASAWQSILLVPALGWLCWSGPKEHFRWSVGIALLTLLASALAPQPVPILLLVMAAAACLSLILEKFNPAGMHWKMVSGIALYALVGVGSLLFQAHITSAAANNPLVSQGQTYIGIMAAIGLYGIPLAYLAMLAQGLLVHPPIPGTGRPEELINTLRARRQD